MTTLEQRLTEAEKLVREVKEEIEREKIKPVFPHEKAGTGICVMNGRGLNLLITVGNEKKDYSRIGNSFYNKDELYAERKRREAEVRVRERINIVNKGDNGFKKGRDNFYFIYSMKTNKFIFMSSTNLIYTDPWKHIRTKEAANELLEDKRFVNDLKAMYRIIDGQSFNPSTSSSAPLSGLSLYDLLRPY